MSNNSSSTKRKWKNEVEDLASHNSLHQEFAQMGMGVKRARTPTDRLTYDSSPKTSRTSLRSGRNSTYDGPGIYDDDDDDSDKSRMSSTSSQPVKDFASPRVRNTSDSISIIVLSGDSDEESGTPEPPCAVTPSAKMQADICDRATFVSNSIPRSFTTKRPPSIAKTSNTDDDANREGVFEEEKEDSISIIVLSDDGDEESGTPNPQPPCAVTPSGKMLADIHDGVAFSNSISRSIMTKRPPYTAKASSIDDDTNKEVVFEEKEDSGVEQEDSGAVFEEEEHQEDTLFEDKQEQDIGAVVEDNKYIDCEEEDTGVENDATTVDYDLMSDMILSTFISLVWEIEQDRKLMGPLILSAALGFLFCGDGGFSLYNRLDSILGARDVTGFIFHLAIGIMVFVRNLIFGLAADSIIGLVSNAPIARMVFKPRLAVELLTWYPLTHMVRLVMFHGRSPSSNPTIGSSCFLGEWYAHVGELFRNPIALLWYIIGFGARHGSYRFFVKNSIHMALAKMGPFIESVIAAVAGSA